ncbi:MAG: dienelactone hydrolase family protein [Actinomycetota bacterium]|nr:dienelactone hydrolase family protein [Actinomycetota bacterium]
MRPVYARSVTEREILIDARGAALAGDLSVPDGARGVVTFAHGSGSSRHSPRNRAVATAMQQRGFATLLMDLLTEDEERQEARAGHQGFDIELLAQRLAAAIDGLPSLAPGLPIGLFGASTGAAAALAAAAVRPAIGAVVSRGGRPDLAGDVLGDVSAPTLLIVGARDDQVLELNRQAMSRMRCQVSLEIVPGAAHLFEEPGALEEVSRLAGDWFELAVGFEPTT